MEKVGRSRRVVTNSKNTIGPRARHMPSRGWRSCDCAGSRALRRSAQDLFLPARSSDELLHLARRMNYLPEENNADVGSLLLNDFQRHTNAVKRFLRKRFNRSCPGQ